MQLLVIQFTIKMFHTGFMQVLILKKVKQSRIGVGAGTDIVFPTSKTQVCRTNRPTKSLSAPARRSVSWVMQSSQHGSHVE